MHHSFAAFTILLHCKQKIGCCCCLKLSFGGSSGIKSPIGSDNGDILKVEGVVVVTLGTHMLPWSKQKEMANDDAVCYGVPQVDRHCCICSQCIHRVFNWLDWDGFHPVHWRVLLATCTEEVGECFKVLAMGVETRAWGPHVSQHLSNCA